MVAEIGGYSGLLIGFSLMDLVWLIKQAAHMILSVYDRKTQQLKSQQFD